ncbi:MAG: hypothetical protein WBC04_23340 [Candidatus Acidiferrales bacterium]|jgi:hypothetical protein
MAIARCEKCGKPTGPNVKPPGYSKQPYLPVGHPSSGVICGKPDCENAGLIWLKVDEAQAYQLGQRVFEFSTHTAKVCVQ